MARRLKRVTIAAMIRKTSIPLVSCRDCASPLLQPLDVVGPIGGTSIVTRFCPECERRDIVVAEDIAVQTWLRRDECIAAWMTASADVLASELMRSERPAGR
jgi:hypothetical protein